MAGRVELADVRCETFPLATPFVISRGAKSVAETVLVTLQQSGFVGRGEAVPYRRYGESIEATIASIQSVADQLCDRNALQNILPPGAARNALDCAFWDLEAKVTARTVWQTLDRSNNCSSIETFYTLSLGTPDEMAGQARAQSKLRCLKLKLGGGPTDHERMKNVRDARPDARLVADANEAWDAETLNDLMTTASQCGFEMIEQPLPAASDDPLTTVSHSFPDVALCADESAHTSDDLAKLTDRYAVVNIKLDKAGGLTEALAMAKAARDVGLKVMVGSMVSSSLGIAPAMVLARDADWVDLDSPLLLAKDRTYALKVSDNGFITPPTPELWG